MSAEVIEGEVIESALTVIHTEPTRLATSDTPEDMIGLATRMATALKDIVERQKLYAVISGKKFPQVEAWMTIGRMDNVVAREIPTGVIRHDDGSYEATVELVRLSDGLVIGRASALCGTPDDKPWSARSEPARRSMAVTRATSRAFRQQYSWIMALAGYEPTPAEEMPRDERPPDTTGVMQGGARTVSSPPPTSNGGLVGIAKITEKQSSDGELRQTPDGWVLGFRLTPREGDKGGTLVEAKDALAEALAAVRSGWAGQPVTVWGRLEPRSFTPAGKPKVNYQALVLERIQTPDFTLPAPDGPSQLAPEDEAELDAIAI